MSGWVVVVLVVYTLGALVLAGVMLERSLDEKPSSAWWAAWFMTCLAWPVVLLFWDRSRPAPLPQPTEPTERKDPVHSHVFTDKELREMPTWVFHGHIAAVDTAHSLALCGRAEPGHRVWVKDLDLILERGYGNVWAAVDCACRYNAHGFPVVLCREHRSDVDPQGEPDEDEEEVGR